MSKTAKKEEKAQTCLAIFVPTSGAPYDVEVKVEPKGTVTWNEKTWHVSPGSIWTSGKTRRVILPEGAAESFHGGLLHGKFYMTCSLFFYYMKMTILEELFRLQNRKPWFKQGSTWVIAGAIGLLALVLVWLVVDVNGGLNRIAQAIQRTLEESASNGAGSGGHNDIAPNGT